MFHLDSAHVRESQWETEKTTVKIDRWAAKCPKIVILTDGTVAC